MSQLIEAITSEQLRNDVPTFRPGDTVRVHARIVEGERERIQLFEGVVIKRRGAGISETLQFVKFLTVLVLNVHSLYILHVLHNLK